MMRTIPKQPRCSSLFFYIFISAAVIVFLLPKINFAQQNVSWSEITLLSKSDNNPYVEFYSEDIEDLSNPAGQNVYASLNLFDGFLKTCWVAGSAKTGKNTVLYVRLPQNIPLEKIILNIFSGYGKSKKLYFANARPKKLELTLFAAFNPEGFSSEYGNLYIIRKSPWNMTIETADTFALQSFPLNLNRKSLRDFQTRALSGAKSYLQNKMGIDPLSSTISTAFILKMEIADSYKGSKYDDVCISELFFNDRFVTPYPDTYFDVNNVYIENENILLADYSYQKGVIVYKNPSSVFTYADWPEHKKWAILHYVPNDEVGEGSRVEELSALIDLKNRKNVTKEFERCTGTSAMFITFTDDENGRLFIDANDFQIELR